MKRVIALFSVLVLGVTMMACSNKSSIGSEKKDIIKEEAKQENKLDLSQDSAANKQNQDNSLEEKETESEVPQAIDLNIYYPNEMYTAFEFETVQVTEITPEIIVSELIKKGIFPGDVTVQNLTELSVDGQNAMDLDLSEGYSTYISSVGSSGEYYALGSLCNTFLEAYGKEKIKITVNGNALSTGHNEYVSYLGYYK